MSARLLMLVILCFALAACAGTNAQPTLTLAPSPVPQTETPIPAPKATATAKPEATVKPQATAKPQATDAPAPTSAPTAKGLRTVECQFDVPTGYEVTCGYVRVPEDRANSTSRMIELAVAIFKSKSANPEPDPIIYLDGGPGGNSLQGIPLSFAERFAPFLANRDFIMFDQRGTGFSKPSLACDEYTKLAYDTLDKNINVAESNRLATDALIACHSRLQSQGVNFKAYNSLASAADLADLRIALGYKEWNLYGISYGTRLALTTMREHPDGIRSVILDSTVPLQSSETDTPASADRGFEQLFKGCADDPDCNKAFPKLRDTFYKLVDQLDKKPVSSEATNPLNGKKYTVLLNGASLISVVFQGMYSTSIIPQLPKAIAAAAAGTDYSLFMRLALSSAIENEYVSVGMFYTVRCNEEVPFDTTEALQNAEDTFPQQHGVFDLSSYIPICSAWEAGKAPAIENQPVSSDIPTIVLSGQYDPITTPADGQVVAKNLSRSFFFEFPGLGHGVSIDNDCPRGMTEAFLNDPTSKPNDSCIAQMSGPAFVGTGRAVKLVPIEQKDFGFNGVIPDGWKEINAGIYARSQSADVVIFELALPGTQADALSRLSGALKLEGDQKPTGQLQTNALNWDLYQLTIQGQPADLALADGGDRTFIVMLVSDNAERQELYDGVFVPVLKALTPIK